MFTLLLLSLAAAAAAAAKLLQLCPTLRPRRQQPNRLSCPWDSPARTLEWAAISFSIPFARDMLIFFFFLPN